MENKDYDNSNIVNSNHMMKQNGILDIAKNYDLTSYFKDRKLAKKKF